MRKYLCILNYCRIFASEKETNNKLNPKTRKGIEIMKTLANNNEMMTKAINHAENMVSVCNKQIEYLTHPETYGCCLSKCNSIVINKERMMTVTTDETHHTTYEFSPLYPTYFSPEAAREIVENDIYKDINDQPIKMEIVGKLEYYQLLKVWAEDHLRIMKSVMC